MAQKPVPPRNWRKWGYAYLAHATTGAISGAGVGWAIGASEPLYFGALAVIVLSFTRQTVEYLRRGDTPGRDMGDSLTGFVCAGVGAFTAGVLI